MKRQSKEKKMSTDKKVSKLKPSSTVSSEKGKADGKPDIWFDDVDEMLLDPEDRPSSEPKKGSEADIVASGSAEEALVKEKSFKGYV